MTFLTPQPRYRIYTKPTYYVTVLKDLLFNNHHGAELDNLSKAIQEVLHISYAIPMPTARFAIYISLKTLLRSKRKVILSPYTIVDVINMVICAGGEPIFADIDPVTCNIDPNEIEKLIDGETGAVLITHLHGLACNLKKIKELCQRHHVPLIEDCAQAFTGRYDNRYVGTIGDAGIFSFGMYKIVNSFYGGMLVTPDKSIYAQIKNEMEKLPFFSKKLYLKKCLFALATDISTAPGLFQTLTYPIFRQAYLREINWINNIVKVDKNPVLRTKLPKKYQFKMTSTQAKLILNQLDSVQTNNEARLAKAQFYYEALQDIPDILLPPMYTDFSHLYTYYPIQVPNREEVVRIGHLNKRDWMLCHYHNLADLECFQAFKRECPNARSVSRSLIYLPTYPRYNQTEMEENVTTLRKIFIK